MIKTSTPLRSKIANGFTLVETLIYMGLLSIFLVVLTNLFVSTVEVKTEAEARSSVDQDGRYMVGRLAYDISRATSISSPASIGGSASSLSMVIGGETYTYALSGNNLVLTTPAGSANLNSSESTVSGLSFQRIGNAAVTNSKDTIRVLFTATSVTSRAKGKEVRSFQTTVGRKQ